MPSRRIPLVCLILAPLAWAACGDAADPAAVDPSDVALQTDMAPAAPAPLVTVPSPFGSLTFWPFTGEDFSGSPSDPVNVIFAGESDPASLRALLMGLDGDRTAFGFPDAFPFNCTWGDAIGGMQTSYGEPAAWVGGAIQLECGEYSVLRFHLRLFDVGGWTLGGAHFETLIPGTTSHQVLSWELAEQLVIVDFVRSGALDTTIPLFPAGVINPGPFRSIPAAIYNGLPLSLRAAIGGPLADQVVPVPIGSDGAALILNVAQSAAGSPGVVRQDFVVQFGQVIPKPFCASGPFDYILVEGPVSLRQLIAVSASGNYVSQFQAQGTLTVQPVNPLTSPPTPIGEPYSAHIVEHARGIVTDRVTLVSQLRIQALMPHNAGFGGRLMATLHVGPAGAAQVASLSVTCDQ